MAAAFTLTLHGDRGRLGGKVTQYQAMGDPHHEIVIYSVGNAWRVKRRSRGDPNSKWQEWPGKFASPEEAKEELEA
jgi:hypothetical protein